VWGVHFSCRAALRLSLFRDVASSNSIQNQTMPSQLANPNCQRDHKTAAKTTRILPVGHSLFVSSGNITQATPTQLQPIVHDKAWAGQAKSFDTKSNRNSKHFALPLCPGPKTAKSPRISEGAQSAGQAIPPSFSSTNSRPPDPTGQASWSLTQSQPR
jgi:hypothetical protein